MCCVVLCCVEQRTRIDIIAVAVVTNDKRETTERDITPKRRCSLRLSTITVVCGDCSGVRRAASCPPHAVTNGGRRRLPPPARSPPPLLLPWRLPLHAATRGGRHSLPPPTALSSRRSALRAPARPCARTAAHSCLVSSSAGARCRTGVSCGLSPKAPSHAPK